MGLKGKDFVVVCSDTCASQSIIRMKADEDKLVKVDDHKLFALSGVNRVYVDHLNVVSFSTITQFNQAYYLSQHLAQTGIHVLYLVLKQWLTFKNSSIELYRILDAWMINLAFGRIGNLCKRTMSSTQDLRQGLKSRDLLLEAGLGFCNSKFYSFSHLHKMCEQDRQPGIKYSLTLLPEWVV